VADATGDWVCPDEQAPMAMDAKKITTRANGDLGIELPSFEAEASNSCLSSMPFV
jgi:hypothetical protein